jgi:hypothetical protein
MIDDKECGLKLTPAVDIPGLFECSLGHRIYILIFEKKPEPPESK